MTDPIRAALERLVGLHNDDGAWGLHWDDAIADARAALADEADGPAVPEGREPASVAGEPSDEDLWGLDQLEESWNAQADAANNWNELGLDEIIVWAQRQALARWGHQPAPVVPVAVSDALIKAECSLSDIAEGEETIAAPNTFEWAEQRCAETLAIIRPVMKRHGIRTSEWPPQPLPQAEEVQP